MTETNGWDAPHRSELYPGSPCYARQPESECPKGYELPPESLPSPGGHGSRFIARQEATVK